MITFKGKSVSNGIAIGKISFFGVERVSVKRVHIDDIEAEKTRFEQAKITAALQLGELYEKALAEVGEANAQIFEVHQMMLEDDDYRDSILNIIGTQAVNAEYAVAVTSDNFSEMFSQMDDEYMRERAADVRDISDRLIKILMSVRMEDDFSGDERIVCSDDLTPSETVQMDKNSVIAFVMRKGSSNSHTAILARTMQIPAVIGVGEALLPEYDGKLAVINAFTGEIYIDPDEQTLTRMRQKLAEYREQKELIKTLKGKDNITKDGQKINLFANIGSLADVGNALQNDAGGIGLFRSEFLYLSSSDYPTEDQQFAVYKAAAENMAGKPVIIRTLDIGADKQIDYFDMPKEDNPAMGWRAIRICLDRPEVFKTQLRALCRASAFGNVMVMFPMIASVWEIRRIKEILKEVQEELTQQGIKFNENMPIGIMIETPAAALCSDELAQEVSFFSIGTNDLTQYTLAADRQNNRLDRYCNTHHPAVLRLIKMTCENARKNGIWCGICGELGADTELTEFFLSIGMDELSMSPGAILEVRKKVRETTVSDIRAEKFLYSE